MARWTGATSSVLVSAGLRAGMASGDLRTGMTSGVLRTGMTSGVLRTGMTSGVLRTGITSGVLRAGITLGVLRTCITSGGRHREVSWRAAFYDIIISSASVERSSIDISSVLCRRTLTQLGNVCSQISFFRSTSLFFESSSVSGKRLSIQISSHS